MLDERVFSETTKINRIGYLLVTLINVDNNEATVSYRPVNLISDDEKARSRWFFSSFDNNR